MLDAISAGIRDSHSLEEIERRGITANFEYLARRPEIDRVMNEAEVVAPDAFNLFMRQMQERYRRSLVRSREAGELRGFSDDEIEVVAALLTGARSYSSGSSPAAAAPTSTRSRRRTSTSTSTSSSTGSARDPRKARSGTEGREDGR